MFRAFTGVAITLATTATGTLAGNVAPINISQGMTYDQARKILISDGWQAIYKPYDRSCPDYVDRCKWPETETCAVTGTGPCISYFGDIYRNVLKVHSNGSRGINGISRFYLTK